VAILRAPSSLLISKLVIAALFILFFTLIFTILLVMKSLRPLRLLRDCTSEMVTLDPSSASSLNAMEAMLAERLNVKRRDELGDLARSFATMGRGLVQNIRESMRVMTAQKRLEGELSAAKDIQMSILPTLDASFDQPGFMVRAFLEPAQEVGGDLYDCFTVKDQLKAIVIGDVSGKGVPAALFMTMTVTLVRYALRSNLDPAQAMTQVNALLEEHNSGSMFVTLFLGLFNPQTGELLYTNGGHCLPFILGPKGELRQLERLSGPLVGVMPDISYLLFKDCLQPGERCFLYTDGLTEAMNSKKELYGEERIAACLRKHAEDGPKEIQEAVFADICTFRGEEPPSDDITMLTLARPS
ncbi:MAG: SpoIIE family protein phosphatase, partial [Desulfovibrionaceae bacterium]|nr:SpoIIE family protein phosphatase [Desulfovibrionaceae bacterium]